MWKIREYKKSDTADILEFTDVNLGNAYIKVSDLQDFLILVAEDLETEKCVGVCLFYIDAETNRGVVKTVVVASEFSGKGIGTKLISSAVENLQSRGIEKFISPLWKSGDRINSDIIFRRNGFVPVKEIPDYWYEDSLLRNYSCPVCGSACHCSCVIYEKC